MTYTERHYRAKQILTFYLESAVYFSSKEARRNFFHPDRFMEGLTEEEITEVTCEVRRMATSIENRCNL